MSLNTEKLCWYGRHGSFSKICACPENVRYSVKTLVTVRRQSLPRVGRSNYSAAFSHSCVLLRQQGLLELYGRPEKTVVSARNATSLNRRNGAVFSLLKKSRIASNPTSTSHSPWRSNTGTPQYQFSYKTSCKRIPERFILVG